MENLIIEKEKIKLKESILKGIVLEPKEIQFKFSPEEQLLKDYLKNWYEGIFNFRFTDIIKEVALEYIFHSSDNIQILTPNETLFETSDYTQDDFELALLILCLKNGIAWNQLNPFVSFNTVIQGRNYRASLSHSSLSLSHQSKLYLRPLNNIAYPLTSFYCDIKLIKKMIKSKDNILIAGATGSGKTSFINSMLIETCPKEHMVILEDTQELLSPHRNTTRFISNPEKSYTLENYMTYSMRMSPKRIIIGELRSNEVESFLLALNTGHTGCMSTIHANSAQDAVHRLALLYQVYSKTQLPYNVIIDLISKSINKIVFLKNREVKEIIHLIGSDSGQVFFRKDL